jgi:hypothetical protein
MNCFGLSIASVSYFNLALPPPKYSGRLFQGVAKGLIHLFENGNTSSGILVRMHEKLEVYTYIIRRTN